MNKILIIVGILVLIILEFNIFNLKNILEKLKKYFRLLFFILLILVVVKYNKTKDSILPFNDIIKNTKQYKFLSNWTLKINRIISLFSKGKSSSKIVSSNNKNNYEKMDKFTNYEKIFKVNEKKNTAKRNLSESKKKVVASNQSWKCLGCQNLLDATYEIDHIIPLYKNGTNDIDNLQALCRNCHGKKTLLDKIK